MRERQDCLHSQRGITLVEVVMATTVMAIAAASAAPSFQRFIDKQRLDGAAAQLASDIQFTRAEAVLRNTGLRLRLQSSPWGSCYVIHTGAAGQCECPASGPAQCSGDAQALKTVQLRGTDNITLAGNVSSILFDPLHGTASPTATLNLTVASGAVVRHIVNVMGRVRTCSPQGSAAGYVAC